MTTTDTAAANAIDIPVRPPVAPAGEPLERVRDRFVAHTLRRRMKDHPAIAALADMYERRIAGDEPTGEQWAEAWDQIALDSDLDLDLALVGDLDLDSDLARAIARALARDSALALDLDLDLVGDLVALLGPSRLPPVDRLDAAILGALSAKKWLLNMGRYHGETDEAGTCGTTHCRAGSAIVIHPLGLELEKVFGPWLAGAVIYKVSTGRVPDFFASNEDAMADMRRGAAA